MHLVSLVNLLSSGTYLHNNIDFDGWTYVDGRTYGPTAKWKDRQMDKPSFSATMHQKTDQSHFFSHQHRSFLHDCRPRRICSVAAFQHLCHHCTASVIFCALFSSSGCHWNCRFHLFSIVTISINQSINVVVFVVVAVAAAVVVVVVVGVVVVI